MTFDIAFSPVERRGGVWGYWRMYADSSRFIARGWQTKREATVGRLLDAQNEKLKVRLDEPSAKTE